MDDTPSDLTPDRPAAAEVEEVGINATIASVLALVVGLLVSGGLLVVSVAISLCGLFGETCTPEEEAQSQLAFLGAVVTFLGVPALVAVVRRDLRWMYAPFIEVIVGMSIAVILVAF